MTQRLKRKRISDTTKLAAALLDRGEIPYEHAKLMGETNFLSLYQYDHNILHESGHPDRDEFWNLKPRLIREHREKTKLDLKLIAKGRRIRRENHQVILNREMREFARENPDRAVAEAFMAGTYDGMEQATKIWTDEANRPGGALKWAKAPRKIPSRGFDKRLRRKWDGTVVQR